jgi:hypothetical protein
MDADYSQIFYNSETNRPFDQCLVCSKALTDPSEAYFVEKIFRRSFAYDTEPELLFEYAVCENCTATLRNELSKSSLKAIEQFFQNTLTALPSMEEKDKLSQCLITRKPIAKCESYSFHARFVGPFLQESVYPYAISDEAVEAISALLSKETLDVLDNFKGRYFSGPPELADLINPKRLLPL